MKMEALFPYVCWKQSWASWEILDLLEEGLK
jgi:hypothetical protein